MGKACAVPYRDIQDEAPKAHCESCGGELYGYEKVYRHAGEELCRECFIAAMQDWVEEAPDEVAGLLGVEVETL